MITTDFYREIDEMSDYMKITCSNNPVEIQDRISTYYGIFDKEWRNAC